MKNLGGCRSQELLYIQKIYTGKQGAWEEYVLSHTQYPLFTGPGRRAAHPSLEARLKLQPETSLVAVPFKPFKLQTCGF